MKRVQFLRAAQRALCLLAALEVALSAAGNAVDFPFGAAQSFGSPVSTLLNEQALSLPVGAIPASGHPNAAPEFFEKVAEAASSRKSVPDDEGAVLLSIDGSIATITISRPPVNAWSTTMFKQTAAYARRLYMNPSIRLVILKADGKRFGVGGDIKAIDRALDAKDYHVVRQYYRDAAQMFEALEQLRRDKPVVSFAQHTIVGGHLAFGTAGLSVIDPDAIVSFPEIRLGLFPENGAAYRLTRRVGLGYALYMALTGHELTGLEARYRGLADVSLRPSDFDAAETALRVWVHQTSGPVSRRELLKTLRAFEHLPPRESSFLPVSLFETLFTHPNTYDDFIDSLGVAASGDGQASLFAKVVFDELGTLSQKAVHVAYHLMRSGTWDDVRQVILKELTVTMTFFLETHYQESVDWIVNKKRAPDQRPRVSNGHKMPDRKDLRRILGRNIDLGDFEWRFQGTPALLMAKPQSEHLKLASKAWSSTKRETTRAIMERFRLPLAILHPPFYVVIQPDLDGMIWTGLVRSIAIQLDLGLLSPGDVNAWIVDELANEDLMRDERLLVFVHQEWDQWLRNQSTPEQYHANRMDQLSKLMETAS